MLDNLLESTLKTLLITFIIVALLTLVTYHTYKASIHNGDTIIIRGEPHMIIEYDYTHNRVRALSPDNNTVWWPYN